MRRSNRVIEAKVILITNSVVILVNSIRNYGRDRIMVAGLKNPRIARQKVTLDVTSVSCFARDLGLFSAQGMFLANFARFNFIVIRAACVSPSGQKRVPRASTTEPNRTPLGTFLYICKKLTIIGTRIF